MPGTIGTPAAFIRARDSVFDPIAAIESGSGPTQTSPASLHRPRERGVLGEEAEAGVDEPRPGPLRGVDELLRDEVRLAGRGGTDADGVVGEADVERGPVGVGEDGHGRDPEVAAGPDDPDGDLARGSR